MAKENKISQSCFCQLCGAWKGTLGNEPLPDLFIRHLVGIFNEVKRVLKPDGLCWINIGDSYIGGGRGYGYGGKQDSNHGCENMPKSIVPQGLKPTDLALVPERLVIALQEAGWYIRSDIVWNKINAFPESVKTRCTKSHEYIFMIAKSQRYYYDADAIKERSECSNPDSDSFREHGKSDSRNEREGLIKPAPKNEGFWHPKDYRNKRDVWTLNTKPYSGAHFAVFPPDIPEICIKASTRPGDIVLDPFAGSCTTCAVAKALGRNYIGIEANPDYIILGEARIRTFSFKPVKPTLRVPKEQLDLF